MFLDTLGIHPQEMSKPETTTVGFAILVSSAISMAWWWDASSRFVTPVGVSATMRALPPDIPSIPSLSKNNPIPVPGFETLTDCFSPTLSADLKQIAFAKDLGQGGEYDLHIASRINVEDAFGTPVRIESTLSAEPEFNPALSPDGLELLFVRSDVKPEIWLTKRNDVSSEFGPPQLWNNCRMGDKTSRVGSPQFVSRSEVIFSRIDAATNLVTIWSCQRTIGGQYEAPIQYASSIQSSTMWFNIDGRRAYHGSESALYLLWRSDREAMYLPPTALLDATLTGPIRGRIWIAPKEDIVFYCSPGPGRSIESRSQLWMIGF